MDVIHNLTGYRFGYMEKLSIRLNQKSIHEYGTEGRNRTGTPVKEPDFESGASTSSATPARAGVFYSKSWQLAVISWQ